MSNPFDEEADDSALTAPSHRAGGSGTAPTKNRYTNLAAAQRRRQDEQEEDVSFYEAQIESAMQSSLDSTKRSLQALEESESVGVATAEDLLSQGEKLRATDRRLDEINATTAQSQRHLNNIKSVFGGIKNYFKKPPTVAASSSQPPATGKLNATVGNLQDPAYTAPAASQLRQQKGKPPKAPPAAVSDQHTLSSESRNAIAGTRWGAMDDEVEENLGMMASNLTRLRQLGGALGQEIETQNELLDKLQVKTDKANTVIRYQDHQMKHILGMPEKTSSAPTLPARGK